MTIRSLKLDMNHAIWVLAAVTVVARADAAAPSNRSVAVDVLGRLASDPAYRLPPPTALPLPPVGIVAWKLHQFATIAPPADAEIRVDYERQLEAALAPVLHVLEARPELVDEAKSTLRQQEEAIAAAVLEHAEQANRDASWVVPALWARKRIAAEQAVALGDRLHAFWLTNHAYLTPENDAMLKTVSRTIAAEASRIQEMRLSNGEGIMRRLQETVRSAGFAEPAEPGSTSEGLARWLGEEGSTAVREPADGTDPRKAERARLKPSRRRQREDLGASREDSEMARAASDLARDKRDLQEIARIVFSVFRHKKYALQLVAPQVWDLQGAPRATGPTEFWIQEVESARFMASGSLSKPGELRLRMKRGSEPFLEAVLAALKRGGFSADLDPGRPPDYYTASAYVVRAKRLK